MSNEIFRQEIIPGSKADFWVDLVNEADGRGLTLVSHLDNTNIARFTNCDGDIIEVPLTLTTEDASCGSVFVIIDPTNSSKFDKKSVNFDLVFSLGTPDEAIYPVSNMLEITEPNVPV